MVPTEGARGDTRTGDIPHPPLFFGSEMTQSEKNHQPGNTQVPGQLLGYGLQYTRMLSLLFESDSSSVVSLEVFEDVGVEGNQGTLASQTKSSTTTNPVSNSAQPLWKTLGNWLDAIKNKQLETHNTVFELYVFGNFDGDICTLFSDAKSEAEARSALSKARQVLLNGSKDLPKYISDVLGAGDNELVPLIMHFRYEHGSGQSIEDLKEKLTATMIPTEFVDTVLTYALGWVKKEVDILLEQKKTAAISVAAFRKEIAAYARSIVFSVCFADLAGPARPEDIEKSRSQCYVRQLDLISIDDDRKLHAISAYLRSSVNRAKWGILGLVHDHSLDDYESRLTEYWKNSRAQCNIELSRHDEVERGQFLLSECMKFSPPLQGAPVPYDFTEGCFHALADELTIGWHPAFEDLTAG